MISLANLQLGSVLILYVAGDDRIPLNCAMGKINLDHGTVSFDRTLLDTTHSLLHVDGKATLGDQRVDSRLTADPKKFDLLDLHSPVLIRGKLRDPDISIGKKIPIPAPELGGAKGVQCDEAIKQLLSESG